MTISGDNDVLCALPATSVMRGGRADGSEESLNPKSRQSAKITEIGGTLVAAGYTTLDAQADVVGLSRSTVWTIRRGAHKNSGLSAAIVKRMLASPRLPPLVRAKIIEYLAEKADGLYGDPQSRLRQFSALLAQETVLEDRSSELRKRRRSLRVEMKKPQGKKISVEPLTNAARKRRRNRAD